MPTAPPDLEMLTPNSPFRQVLYRRYAARAYRPGTVDKARLMALLDAAVHAPTARHQEPWEFLVIQDRAVLRRISEKAKALARARALGHGNVLKEPGTAGDGVASPLADPAYDVFHGAGTLVVICARPTPEHTMPDAWLAHAFVVADCWLAAENLMLAACASGLGTCCIGFAVPALNDPELKAVLGIPGDMDAVAPIVVGVPAAGAQVTPRKPPVVLNWLR